MFEGERALGATFAPERIGWIDFETRNPVTDLKAAGAYRYSLDAIPIICSYAIGDGPVRKITRWQGLRWRDMPEDFHAHHFDVRQGNTVWAAWNAGFDKAIWNFSTDFHVMEPEHIIDVQCQAAASGFPADLKWSSRLCGGAKKDDAGKDLIKLFCGVDATHTPETKPEEWLDFLDYADDDVRAMRDVFKRTRQLSLAEWREYWAMEKINERGAAIDLDMVKTAAALADVDRIRSSHELRQITAGEVTTVDQVKRMVEWLLFALPDKAHPILTKRLEEVDEDGTVTRPPKYSLTRKRVEKLIAFCHDCEVADPILLKAAERVLQIRLYGGSKTPAKFNKMLAQHVDGTLFGQYTFNGAGQTGRASSRGVQVHNLARDTLEYEERAIEALVGGCSYDHFAALGGYEPVSRKLSLLIRPAFVPDPGQVFVWSDWSQIEARVLPWLAGNDPGALARLKIFQDVDRNPNLPDLYTRTAATLSHVSVEQVTKAIRQRGKVAELALGFGGGLGALQAMAANYGLYLDDAEAKATVETWRTANKWCVFFWGAHLREDGDGAASASYGLWGAIHRAMAAPGVPQQAGRITYLFQQGWLPGDYHGSLLCILPSGRILTYRDLRSELVDELDDDDNVVGQSRKLRFSRGLSRVHFWHGLACENVVQATAADFLRGTLRRLGDDGAYVRLHTHDEILLQITDEQRDVAAATHLLRQRMREGFDWSQDLPLMSDERVEPYYTKMEN